MYAEIMKRLVVMLGVTVALICFIINISLGADFFYAAFMALCVMFAASAVFMIAFQAVAQVLFKHLAERQRVKRMMRESEMTGKMKN